MHVHACPSMSKHVQVSHSLRPIMLATIAEEEEEREGDRTERETFSINCRMMHPSRVRNEMSSAALFHFWTLSVQWRISDKTREIGYVIRCTVFKKVVTFFGLVYIWEYSNP